MSAITSSRGAVFEVLMGAKAHENENLVLSMKTQNELQRLTSIYRLINAGILSFNDREILYILFSNVPDRVFGRQLTDQEKELINSIELSTSRPLGPGKISLETALHMPRIKDLLGEYALQLMLIMDQSPSYNEPFHREEFATMSLEAHEQICAENRALLSVLSVPIDDQYKTLRMFCHNELKKREELIEQLKMNQELLKQFSRNRQVEIQRMQIQLARGTSPSKKDKVPKNAIKV